jgi:hypothetical protein
MILIVFEDLVCYSYPQVFRLVGLGVVVLLPALDNRAGDFARLNCDRWMIIMLTCMFIQL